LNLYDGIAGIGLFMAALATVTNGVMWRHAALGTVRPLRQLLERATAKEILAAAPIGACDGVGSIVYALSWMSRFLEDISLADLAVGLTQTLTKEQIDTDTRLDVVGGSAGAILCLLALHHVVREPGLLELAECCGDHLLAAQVTTGDGGGAWPAQNKHPLAGFAHGAAGIAYTLTSLFRLTGKQELLDAAKRAYLYERSLFSPAKANWPIVQGARDRSSEQGAFMTAWCHGAPGVGLARVLNLDELCDEHILEEIDTAIHTTAHLERNRSDHICCGNLGRSDVILTTGLRMVRPNLVDAAKAVAVQVTSRAREQQRFFLPTTPFQYSVLTPGFFRGLSGIGYQLLRIAYPERLPSVLSFEPDLAATATNPRGQS
jgi:type 2 lantibiotic biosynthesis protein LanM